MLAPYGWEMCSTWGLPTHQSITADSYSYSSGTKGSKEKLKSQWAIWTLGDAWNPRCLHAISSSPAPNHSSTVPQKRSIVICIWTCTYITKIRVSSLSWVSLQTWLNLIIMTTLGSITKVETETSSLHRVHGKPRIYTKISYIRTLTRGALLHDRYRPLT